MSWAIETLNSVPFAGLMLVVALGYLLGKPAWRGITLTPGGATLVVGLVFGHFGFTPGIRFPGHLTCGIVRVPFWQFSLADGLAALVSVPTQILLIAYKGDVVVSFLKKFKVAAFAVVLAVALIYLSVRLLRWRRSRAAASAEGRGSQAPGPGSTEAG